MYLAIVRTAIVLSSKKRRFVPIARHFLVRTIESVKPRKKIGFDNCSLLTAITPRPKSMMKKRLLIPILITSGLSLSSCDLLPFDTAPKTNNQSEEISSNTQPKTQQEKVNPEPPNSIPLESRTIEGLTSPTNPDELLQRQGVVPGENRRDPFTLFPVPPQEKLPPLEEQEPPTEQEEEPPAESLPNLGEPPSDLPQPEIAQAVEIQGVVKIGNQTLVILKAPNEQTSRYVRPGQLIANGQVLVKSVNLNQTPTPTVVLEELGVEEQVIKAVEANRS